MIEDILLVVIILIISVGQVVIGFKEIETFYLIVGITGIVTSLFLFIVIICKYLRSKDLL